MLEEDSEPANAADDRALPEPGTLEATIGSMWAELLRGNGVDAGPIHLSDDVFCLGASSLDTILMAERIERAFAIRIADDELFLDRKSTRLNSSHRCISYAVFCLKKKK